MCDGNPTIRPVVGDSKKTFLRKDKNNMNEKLYYTAVEIAQMIGVGRTTAYGIVKQMNEELKSRGFLAVRGKVPKEFFDAKYFGGTRGKEVSA